jgi:hypothetical protein
MVLMESILDRKKPSSGLVLSLIVGFVGIALLSVTTLQTGNMGDIVSLLALVLASISWTLGSLLQSRMPVSLSIEVSAGYQQIFGGLGFVVLVLLTGEPRPTDLRLCESGGRIVSRRRDSKRTAPYHYACGSGACAARGGRCFPREEQVEIPWCGSALRLKTNTAAPKEPRWSLL